MSGDDRPSITREKMNRDGFDPGGPTDDELRSGNRLQAFVLYERLLENGLEEEAEEVREHGSVQQQISIATRHCREHGLSLSGEPII